MSKSVSDIFSNSGKGLLLFLMIFIGSSAMYAQKGTIKASVSKDLVAIGERFKYTIHVENLNGSVNAPNLENFRIVGGPMTERGSSNVNGAVTQYAKFSYFLVATKEGQLTIDPASVENNGKVTQSNAVQIKVVGDQDAVAKSGKKANIRKSEDKNLFIRIYVSDTEVYKGESLTVTYVLYNRYQGTGVSGYELPQLPGFWKEDVKIGDVRYAEKMEKVNGLDYQKAVLARQVLIAQKAGEQSIGPLKIDASVRSGFFNVNQKKLTSNTPIVNVKALPNAPEAFSGGVGKFDFEVNVDNKAVKTNEPITLRVKVSGNGNLKLIGQPDIEFDPDFEVYDPKLQDKISTNGGGMKGSRTYEYLIIPRYAGEYTIDPMAFAYFDPKTEKYVTKKSEAIKINVDGDPKDALEKAQRRKKEVAVLETDIRYIKTDTTLVKKNNYFGGTGSHLALFATPLLLLIGLWFWKRNDDANALDISGTRIRKAGKKALKEIAAAKAALQSNNKEAFHESVFDAMYNYLSEKLNIPYSALSKENIKTALTNRQVDASVIDQLRGVLENCEMARFAPRSKTDDEKMLQTADEVIHHLEKVLS